MKILADKWRDLKDADKRLVITSDLVLLAVVVWWIVDHAQCGLTRR